MNHLLGSGPVAEVYAVDGRALKVFPGKFDRRTLATIERERVKLADLAVPVLPFDGIEVLGGSRHALRMELCVDSLASRVRRDGPLPSEEVAALCASLSHALAAVHARGVLHGGVSPANVLFRANGMAVLADFGVAQRQEFRRDALAGIEWVSPESLRSGERAAPTDVYGLGAVLHFALTGQSPHPKRIGEPTSERLLRVLSDPVPAISRPDVPVGLSTVIGRMLAPDPQLRSLPSTSEVTAERAPARSGRGRWYATAAAAVVALAVVLAVVLWPADPPPETPAAAPPPITRTAGTVVELHAPTDLKDRVELTWTANDDELYFAVVYWEEGEPEREPVVAKYGHTMTVPVDPAPASRYCFLVRGTNGPEIHESQTRSVRGAVCHE
ncbi:serine/threonine-protein kinase [Actinophytocola sediminis]